MWTLIGIEDFVDLSYKNRSPKMIGPPGPLDSEIFGPSCENRSHTQTTHH